MKNQNRGVFIFIICILASHYATISTFGDTWAAQPTGSPPTARSDFAMVFDPDNNNLILYGGLSCSKASCYFSELVVSNETWILDLDTFLWEDVTPSISPPPLWGHKMVYDSSNKKVILFGGATALDWWPAEENRSSETWEYDVTSNTWSKLTFTEEPSARLHHGMVYDPYREKIFLYGGQRDVLAVSDTWVLDYEEMKWTKLYPEIIPLDQSDPYFLNRFARSDYAIAYHKHSRKIIFYGGSDAGAWIQDSTWVYDPKKNIWEEKTPTTGPGRRYNNRMVYDTIHSKCIMFGGGTAPPEGGVIEDLGDTWAYDLSNNSWELIQPESNPSPRFSHEMVYNPFTDQVFMFGGFSNSQGERFNDFWVFNHTDEWQSVPYMTSSSYPTSSSYSTSSTSPTSSKSSTTSTSIEEMDTTTSTESSAPPGVDDITSFYFIPVILALAIIFKCKKRN